MTQMRKRVEGLERRLTPAAPQTVHIVGVMDGQTEADALALYGQPIGEDDFVIWLVGKRPEPCGD